MSGVQGSSISGCESIGSTDVPASRDGENLNDIGKQESESDQGDLEEENESSDGGDNAESGSESESGSDEDRDGHYTSCSDDEDENAALTEILGAKRKLPSATASSSSSSNKRQVTEDNSKYRDSDESGDEGPQYVQDDLDEIETRNIIPRGTRRAAARSGLIRSGNNSVGKNVFASCGEDSEEEADF